MRFREALILFIGICIMVFGLSYFVYRYFFKKDLKDKKMNIFMLIISAIGLAMFLPQTVTFVKEKKGLAGENFRWKNNVV